MFSKEDSKEFKEEVEYIEYKILIQGFKVVELVNSNKATILDIKNNEYFAEIVDRNVKTIENRNITENEIKKVLIFKDKII